MLIEVLTQIKKIKADMWLFCHKRDIANWKLIENENKVLHQKLWIRKHPKIPNWIFLFPIHHSIHKPKIKEFSHNYLFNCSFCTCHLEKKAGNKLDSGWICLSESFNRSITILIYNNRSIKTMIAFWIAWVYAKTHY